jgi:hypothetical protein
MAIKKDVESDYEYIRGSLYNLSEKGNESIELMMDLARESEHPRAFEVLGQLIKQNAEITEKLMDLQKNRKKIEEEGTNNQEKLTQNNVFIGTATDLQKLLSASDVIEHTDL